MTVPSTTAFDELASALTGIDGLTVERDAPAGPLCTYRVGGPITVLVTLETIDALIEAAPILAASAMPTLTIGKGSNLLVAGSGFDGVGLVLGAGFSNIDISGVVVTAGAAAPLPLVARASVRHGLTDFEWAVGVPGTIGGGVRMNAGGHGSDMAATLSSVDVVNLRTGLASTIPAEELGLGYRRSDIGPEHVVISATLRLRLDSGGDIDGGADTTGEAALSEIVRWRRANQPGGQNAGSVFTNPANDSAGRLIDAAGLKTMRVGTAEVSDVHANFIQVDPNGSPDDVMALMREIVASVEAASGIRLHAETRLVGFSDEAVARVQGPNKTETGTEN